MVKQEIKEDRKGKKPNLMKRKMKNSKTIQTVIKKIEVTVPQRQYKSGVIVPEHTYIRTREKQLVHATFSPAEAEPKKFSYVGRPKPLNEGLYPTKRKKAV